jgi:NADP-dependent 3-hydroxy acid dehydrogenase YdfG
MHSVFLIRFYEILVDDTASGYGRLDFNFNNAGIAIGAEVRDCSIDDWHEVLDVNLRCVVHGVAGAYPLMVQQGFGHIINTASIEGLVPFPATVSFAASKFGGVGLSNSLRLDFGFSSHSFSIPDRIMLQKVTFHEFEDEDDEDDLIKIEAQNTKSVIYHLSSVS